MSNTITITVEVSMCGECPYYSKKNGGKCAKGASEYKDGEFFEDCPLEEA